MITSCEHGLTGAPRKVEEEIDRQTHGDENLLPKLRMQDTLEVKSKFSL